MENVESLKDTAKTGTDNKCRSNLDIVIADLRKLGYEVQSKRLDSRDYMVPQRRRHCLSGDCDTRIPVVFISVF